MKLRNKEHRDIIADFQNYWSLCDEGNKIVIKNDKGVSRFEYTSIEQFAKEWETVKEPLLKGDLRLAIKTWAEQCGAKLDDIACYYLFPKHSKFILNIEDNKGNIRTYSFDMAIRLTNLEDCTSYTVEDLVGTE